MKKVLTLGLVAFCALMLGSCDLFIKTIIKEEPTIKPYATYDVADALSVPKNVTYTLEGFYVTSRGVEKEIVFDGTKMMVPEDGTVAEVTVNWTKGSKTTSEVLKINVIGEEDVVDKGMIETWNESSITKTTNYNPAYIKDGESSVKVQFSGYYQAYGTQFININGHLSNNDGKGCYDKEYYDIYDEENLVEAFKDWVFYFWVYNTTPTSSKYNDSSIEIGFRLRTHDDRVNLDWDRNNLFKCQSGEWTLVALRMKDYGITEDLYIDLDSYYAPMVANFHNTFDALNFKVCGNNLTLDEQGNKDYTIKQNYSFYTDGFNMVSYNQFKERFPDVDLDARVMGDNWDESVIGRTENWKYSNKGIAFDFTCEGSLLQPNVFSFIEAVPGAWNRLSDYITLDFQQTKASVGSLTLLPNGKYHYEVYYSDLPLNLADKDKGFTPDGTETINKIYFKSYPNKMTISNVKEITK